MDKRPAALHRLIPSLLLGAVLMALPPPSARATDASRTLTDFGPGSPDLGWRVVNDGVMGGRSEGDFVRRGAQLVFTGRTNTNGGGFSSIRSGALALDLGGFDGIRVRVKGDGRTWTWRLTTDARWRGRTVGYWADFETRKDVWTTVDIPFAAFRPQWRGRKLSGPALDPRRIRGMGLMIHDKRDGPFALVLDRVEAWRRAAPFDLADLRWERRVLVLQAPSADDARLVRQLAEVTEARAAFDERDMLLVVLAGRDGARVDERVLEADEVAALRARLDLPETGFALRLVGKDGGVKRASAAPVPLRAIFEQIDAMPMRRAEMRR